MTLTCECVVCCVKALQSLGCSHVLEAYLQGLTVDGFTSVDSVREIQYEAACQNCKWDLELVTRYYLLSLFYNSSLYIYTVYFYGQRPICVAGRRSGIPCRTACRIR